MRRASDGQVQSTTVGQVSSTASYDPVHAELTDLDYTVAGAVFFHEHLERDTQGRVIRVDETWSGVTTTRQYEYEDRKSVV